MTDQHDEDATPTEDPRGKETSEQNTEESHPGATPPEGGQEADEDGDQPA
jgi:hypothetical protein